MSGRIKAGFLDEEKYERSKRIGWLDINAIKKAKVLVVGAGAIGNETCKNLVLSGYRNISLVDMDYIVRSNLNRCIFFSDLDATKKRLKVRVVAEKLKLLEPEVKVKTYTKKIEELPENFIPSHDIVLGCLDNIAARLHLNAHCYYRNIPYIDAATDGLVGKVQVILPPKTACLECYLNKTHRKILDLRFSCTGRDVTFFENKLAAEITTTAIVSAVQVRESVKITNKRENDVLRNVFYYNGIQNVSEIFEIDINPECAHHVQK